MTYHNERRSHVTLVTLVLLSSLLTDIVHGVFLPLPTEIGDDFEFDLQLTVPYTITLPYYVGRRRRDVLLDSSSPRDTYDHREATLLSAVLGQSRPGLVLGLLDSLFDWLGVDDEPCRQRLICLFTQDPDKYFPLSDLILNHLDINANEEDLESEAMVMMMPNASYSRYILYWDAGRKGLLPKTNCIKETLPCSTDPDDNINWTVVTVVQTLARYLNMRFNSN